MTTIFYLIRHGDIINPLNLLYGRIRDVPLSDKGINQIERVGKRLRDQNEIPAVIFSSPLNRACESARVLQKEFSEASIIIREELTEVSTRHLVGRSLQWVKTLRNPYQKNFQDRYAYEIESEYSQVKRMHTVVKEAVKEYEGKIVAVVSHGDPITFAVDSLVHYREFPRTISELKEDNYYPLRGEAWKIEVDTSLFVLTHKKIMF